MTFPPTPQCDEHMLDAAEIRRVCLEIQKEWTDDERRRRAGLRHYERTGKVMKALHGTVPEPSE